MNSILPIHEEKRTDILKVVAIITMLIDHIGYMFFPSIIIFRIIGRIAFPIFGFHLVLGYRNTSSLKNYIVRLAVLAVISQFPYAYFGRGLNILFTLLLGIFALYLFDNNRTFSLIILFIAVFIFNALIISLDYGLYGVLMILIFHMFFNDKKKLFISFLLLNIVYCIDINYYVQLYSIFAIPLFYLKLRPKLLLNRYLFYAFYPIHIAILLIVDWSIRSIT